MRIKFFKKIDLYILSEIAGPFLGGIVFFTFILLMFQILRMAELLIVHGVSMSQLTLLCFRQSLTFIPISLPVAFLISLLVGFGRLSQDSELVAMKSLGMSLKRLGIPVLLFAGVISWISLSLNQEWVPKAEREFRKEMIKITGSKVVSSIREGTFNSGFFDLLVYADRVDKKTSRLQGVFIYDERESKTPMVVVARAGAVLPVKSQTDTGSTAVLRLSDGSIHRNDLESKMYQKIDFADYQLYLNINEVADGLNDFKPKALPYYEIQQKIFDVDKYSEYYRELQVEYYRRYAIAFSPLAFVFLGIGFGTVRTRSVRSGASLFAIIIVLAYWGLQTFSFMLGADGKVHPMLAVEIPNLVSLLVGVFVFRRASW